MTAWPYSTPKSLHSTPLPGAWEAGREPEVSGGSINDHWVYFVDVHAYGLEGFNEICLKNYFYSHFFSILNKAIIFSENCHIICFVKAVSVPFT